MRTETKICQNCKKDFNIESDDFSFYEKIKVPPPTFCPECRLQRRLAWRNERALYKRKCELCGIDTISMYNPEKNYPSYCNPCFWGDKWNPLDHGQDYDFGKPFFTQISELMKKVPLQDRAVSNKTLINSHFTNMNHGLKDCYYLFNSDYSEKCLYGEEVENSKNSIDVTMIDGTELAYESLNCNKCYQIYYSEDCDSSHDVWFSKNLVGCANCFGCVNLRGQKYCIFNEKYSREEYLEKLKEFDLQSFSQVEAMKEKAKKFWLKFPNKYMHGYQNLNSSGEYIFNSKYVTNSYIATGSEHCKHCMWLIVKNNKDCYDFTQFGENTENIYESLICGKNASNFISNINSLDGYNISYSMSSRGHDLFGCIGVIRKEYCILNKQYTKEEYEELVPKIIEHMNTMPYIDKQGRVYKYGEFFPAELSQFDYNESSAQEYFTLTKEEAVTKGFSWREDKERNYKITVESKDLPDKLEGLKSNILAEIIGCVHQGKCNEQCTTAFRVIEPELDFYKANNLPLPRLCPNCRHYQRVVNRNPVKFWQRQCMCDKKHSHHEGKCDIQFQTSYSPERPEIVYCEKCYQQEVY